MALTLAAMAMVGWELDGGRIVFLVTGNIQRPILVQFVTADNGMATIYDCTSNFGEIDGAPCVA